MNVPTMTIGGEPNKSNDELGHLRLEVKALQERCEELERQLHDARGANELAYMRGRCDGLEFSIRCNVVSGQEVAPA